MDKIIKKLAELSNELDGQDLTEYSERIDDLLEKIASGPSGLNLPNGKVIYTVAEASALLKQYPEFKVHVANTLYGPDAATEALRGATSEYVILKLVETLKQKGIIADRLPSKWEQVKSWTSKNIVQPAKQVMEGIDVPKIEPNNNFVGGYGSANSDGMI